MAFKSKDIVRVTELGENVKETLPLLEYRLLNNLNEPMRVNQIYKLIIDKYPDDYLNSSLEFYKVIELLGSKKLIEKVIIEKEKIEEIFIEEEPVEMSTLATDDIDFIDDNEKERKINRRKDRWFLINKNKFQDSEQDLEIKVKKEKHLDYLNIAQWGKKTSVKNPFYMSENEYENSIKEKEGRKLEAKSRQEKNENMTISFVSPEPERQKKTKTNNSKARSDREKYKKKMSDNKRYLKLKEKNQGFIYIFKDFYYRIKKIFKK